MAILKVNGKTKYFGSFKDEVGKVALQKAKEYGKTIQGDQGGHNITKTSHFQHIYYQEIL